MINSLTQHLSTGNAQSPLLDQLSRRADADRDGTVSTAEFSAFLTSLVQSLDDETAQAKQAAASEPVAQPVTPAPSPTGSPSAKAMASALRTAIAAVREER